MPDNNRKIPDHDRSTAAHLRCTSYRRYALRLLSRPVSAIVLLLTLGTVQAGTPEPWSAQRGSLWLRGAGSENYTESLRLDTAVEIRVAGNVARTRVRQQFRNTGSDWAEGLYVFPLPETAAVGRLRLRIGERIVEGQVRERAAARRSYEQARDQGTRAALVEQQRPNLFTTSLANIAPGETMVVELEYQQPVEFRDYRYHLRFPLAVAPRFHPSQDDGLPRPADAPPLQGPRIAAPAQPVEPVQIEILLHAAGPVEQIHSAYHPVEIQETTTNTWQIRLRDHATAPDHDFELTWRPVFSGTPDVGVLYEQVDGESYSLLTLSPPDLAMPGQTLPPRELVLVIDVSGSMHGTSLEQAQRAVDLALQRLLPHDRFNVIWFNDRSGSLYPAAVPASPEAVRKARAFVAGLSADGGTLMRPALLQALATTGGEERLRQIVFVTDGAVGNEDELFELIGKQLGASRLFTVGIGSAPNGYFMRKAARAGRGTFTWIGDPQETAERMGRLLQRLERPALTDIRLTTTGGGIEMFPDPVPDLYAGEPLVLLARGLQPGDSIAIGATWGQTHWERTLTLEQPVEQSGIRIAWARERIAAAMDEYREAADETARERIKASVVETALAHHLTSRFTSLVAVDTTPAHSGRPMQREQLSNALPRGWNPAFAIEGTTGFIGLPQTASMSGWHILVGMILLLVAGLAEAWRQWS